MFLLSQFFEDWHNNKNEKKINHYDLIRIFTFSLYFGKKKAEELISCPIKNKYMGYDWGNDSVKAKSCQANQMYRTRFWVVKKEAVVII